MPSSLIKTHIQQLAGSGRALRHLIIERSLETSYTEYTSNYHPPSQHVIVAPTSPHTSLAWNKEGLSVRTQNQFIPGDLILNPSGCFTRPQWDRDTRFTLVAIEPASIPHVCDELEIPSVQVPMRFHFRNGALDRTIQRLISCFEANPPVLLEAQALELSLIHHVIGECRMQRDGLHQLSRAKLGLVNDFIEHRLVQSITLDEMAAVAGYSASRFLLLFRNTTGFSPYQYVMRKRLEKAHTLLSHTRLSISEIATDCGFSDQSHFIRLFKRHTGLTPHKFRK
jgi:AraC family transcriptional regulator